MARNPVMSQHKNFYYLAVLRELVSVGKVFPIDGYAVSVNGAGVQDIPLVGVVTYYYSAPLKL